MIIFITYFIGHVSYDKVTTISNLKGWKTYFAHGFRGLSPSRWERYGGMTCFMVRGKQREAKVLKAKYDLQLSPYLWKLSAPLQTVLLSGDQVFNVEESFRFVHNVCVYFF